MKRADFILVPDAQIFDTAVLARSNGSLDHPCLKIFTTAWKHYIDTRERVIYISKDTDAHLIENGYKSNTEKRQALFAILVVREDSFCQDADLSQIHFASRLVISEDKKVYFITDNKSTTEILKEKKEPFEVIDSSKALNMLESLK